MVCIIIISHGHVTVKRVLVIFLKFFTKIKRVSTMRPLLIIRYFFFFLLSNFERTAFVIIPMISAVAIEVIWITLVISPFEIA